MTASAHTPSSTARPSQFLTIGLLALAIAVLVQLIGKLELNVGIGAIVIFPMVWGLLVGLVISLQRIKPLSIDLQRTATAFVAVSVMLLVARLAFNIGPSLPVLLEAGPALLLQEIGHLLGTVALALPLAVLLRMGRATIGATFSLDREPAFAMVSEKYGPDSDQYRGVLAMYVFGTLFGAVYITLLTSLVSNWKIFDPLALAMGAGVGSGSMMAASTASIVSAYPAQEDAILGMAAVSNLITTVLGVYVGIYVALPLADRFYRFLTRRSTTEADPEAPGDAEENRSFRERVAASSAEMSIPLWASLSILTLLGIVTAAIAAEERSWAIVVGYLILVALLLVSIGLSRLTGHRISPIVWATTLGALVSSPWSPIGPWTAEMVGAVDFLSIATITLTCAGLSLGKDVPLLRSIGWKIVPVGLVAITASFLLSVVIAEFALGFWG